MTVTRTVAVESLNDFQAKMANLPKALEQIPNCVFKALNGPPRTETLRTTPLATVNRYAYNWAPDKNGVYHRKRKKGNGQAFVSGTVNQLRTSFKIEIENAENVTFGHYAPYAEYVHEMKNPQPGEYWTPESGKGWTTKGTGQKFIENSLKKYDEQIADDTVRFLDQIMEDNGIW